MSGAAALLQQPNDKIKSLKVQITSPLTMLLLSKQKFLSLMNIWRRSLEEEECRICQKKSCVGWFGGWGVPSADLEDTRDSAAASASGQQQKFSVLLPFSWRKEGWEKRRFSLCWLHLFKHLSREMHRLNMAHSCVWVFSLIVIFFQLPPVNSVCPQYRIIQQCGPGRTRTAATLINTSHTLPTL